MVCSMDHDDRETRSQLSVRLVLILGAISITLVGILVASDEADRVVHVILSVAALLCSVLAIFLGYNVFANVRTENGAVGELKAEKNIKK